MDDLFLGRRTLPKFDLSKEGPPEKLHFGPYTGKANRSSKPSFFRGKLDVHLQGVYWIQIFAL